MSPHRHLANRGIEASVVVFADERQIAGDAKVNLGILLRMAVPLRFLTAPIAWDVYRDQLRPAALVVDALFGTGLRGEVREPGRTAIELLNQARKPVVAVDIPSGLDCDTGQPLGVAVKAEVTVTFARAKVGLLRPEARPYVGRLVVADIGIPPSLSP